MSALAIGLALMALGSAPIDGMPLPDQTVHLVPGAVVTIRLDGGEKPKWVIASTGRADIHPTKRDLLADQFQKQTQSVFKPGQVEPPALMVATGEGYQAKMLPNNDGSVVHTSPTTVDVPLSDAPAAPPEVIPDNAVRLSLRPAPTMPGMLLIVENGFAHMLHYTAVIHRSGRRQQTDVCDVPDHLSSVESWPYAFDSIDLAGFVVTDKTRADGVACR